MILDTTTFSNSCNRSADISVTPSPAIDLTKQILKTIGEDPTREGLRQTPMRFNKALMELTQGYHQSLVGVIGNGIFAAEDTGPVAVTQVEFFSMCEHHMLPFWGVVSVGYIPNEKIIGLSKIPRIIELYARRLQVQERLTRQIGEGLIEAIAPSAVVVRAKASHMCMAMRGIKKINSQTTTEFHFGLESISELQRDRLISVTTES